MPSISTQTSPPVSRSVSFASLTTISPLTPPSTPPEVVHEVSPSPVRDLSPTTSLRNIHVHKRATATGGSPDVPFNLYVDGIHINMPPPQPVRPEMRSVGVQVGEPHATPKPMGPWVKRWNTFCRYSAPVLRLLMVVPLFFLDRVGFGVNVNSLFSATSR